MRYKQKSRDDEYSRILDRCRELQVEATCADSVINVHDPICRATMASGDKHRMAIHLRERGWWISLDGVQSKSVLSRDNVAALLDKIAALDDWDQFCRYVDDLSDSPWLNAQQWRQEEKHEHELILARSGWLYLHGDDGAPANAAHWRCQRERAFNPFQVGCNSQPFWNIQHILRRSWDEKDRIEGEFVPRFLEILQALVPPDRGIFAIERFRPRRLFFPHKGRPEAQHDFWASEVLPWYEDVAFIDVDSQFGFAGDYLSGTVTAFGDELCRNFESLQCELLQCPVRHFPLTIDRWHELHDRWTANGWSRLDDDSSGRVEASIRWMMADFDIDLDDFDEPSCTWDISQVTDSDDETGVARESVLLQHIGDAIQECSSPGVEWYAMCNPSRKLYPICRLSLPVRFDIAIPEAWAVPIVSRFAVCALVRGDFRVGILSHNRLGTLTAIGAELMYSLEESFLQSGFQLKPGYSGSS